MAQSDPLHPEWPLIKKLAVCFFFIFFVLYVFLDPNEIIPYSYYLHQFYSQPFKNLLTWLYRDVFHIVSPEIKFYNGIIDTIFGYLTVLFIFFAAVFGSVIWILLDKKTLNYHRLYQVLIVILRYYLAITWIAYGSLKIIQLQFPSFTPLSLLQTYGNSTPKDLAWAFMGYSAGYNYFIGFSEYAIGLLLFFRRTSTLGNLIAVVTLANVMAFNYSFDVNVKLLSTMLMAMTLFLFSKDIKRLLNFFVLKKIVYPENDRPFRFKTKWKNKAILILKYGFILYLIFFDLHGDMARANQEGAGPAKPPLYGIYNVATFIRNKDTIPRLTTDTTRWKKMVITVPIGNAAIVFMNDSLKHFTFKADTFKKQVEIYDKIDKWNKYTFTYSRPNDSTLLMRGKWRNDSLEIRLLEINMNKLPIMGRRFRWIIDHNRPAKK